jgi:predicted dehydrogenase
MALDTAVVGLGVVSDTHLEGIDANPRTRLAAVSDLDTDRVQATISEYGVPGYEETTELIASESLDWAHICTPVQTHVELGKMFIEAGIPILIEKPIAETTEGVDELQALSREHSVPVTSVQNHIFDPAMRKLTGKLDSGDIGRIQGVDMIYIGQTLPDEANRGSWVFDLPGGEFEEGLPHPIYLTLKAGGWPRSKEAIDARTSLTREYDQNIKYDSAQIQYVTESGVLCSLKMLAGSVPQRRLYVHGTDGSLMADFVSQTVVPVERDYMSSAMSRVQYNADQALARVRGTVENGAIVARRQLDGDWESMKNADSHFYQFDEEAKALETGGEMPVPLEQSWWTIAMMEALRSSTTASPSQKVKNS